MYSPDEPLCWVVASELFVFIIFFYCLVNDDLYLLTTWLPIHGLFFMDDCVWLCCLTYVIVWMSRVKASFKCWSILITNLGKQSSFSPSVFFFFVFVLLHWWFLFSWYIQSTKMNCSCKYLKLNLLAKEFTLSWKEGISTYSNSLLRLKATVIGQYDSQLIRSFPRFKTKVILLYKKEQA